MLGVFEPWIYSDPLASATKLWLYFSAVTLWKKVRTCEPCPKGFGLLPIGPKLGKLQYGWSL